MGKNWRKDLVHSRGVELDTSFLDGLGDVVRLRDISMRCVGPEQASVLVRVAMPAQSKIRDRKVSGQKRSIRQPAFTLFVSALSLLDRTEPGSDTTARLVHNLSPAGRWRVGVKNLPTTVEDLILRLDVSLFARSHE